MTGSLKIEPNKRPYLAVLLAAFNGKEFISQQIKSILKQQKVRLKIFISIDHSSDGTEDLVKSLSRKDQRIVLLKTGGIYGSASANFYRLISEVNVSDFDYVALSDQDDIWKPNKLIRAVNKLNENSLAGYSSNVLAKWGPDKFKIVKKSMQQKKWDYFFESPGPGSSFVLSTFVVKKFKEFLRAKKNLANKIFHHDLLIYAFTRAIGEKWFIDNWISLDYRQHSGNEVGANFGLRALYLRARLVLSGYASNQSFLICQFINTSHTNPIFLGLNSGRKGYFSLAFHARQLRRRRLDQIFIFFCFIYLSIFNPKNFKKNLEEK